MRKRSPAVLRTLLLLATAVAIASMFISFRSSAALAEQVRQVDRNGGSIEFSPILWTGEIGGFLVGAAALAVAIFAGVGLKPTASKRRGSRSVAPILAAAVALAGVGVVAGPFAFPLFLVGSAALLFIAAGRYWGGEPA